MGSGGWNDGLNRVGCGTRRIGLARLVPLRDRWGFGRSPACATTPSAERWETRGTRFAQRAAAAGVGRRGFVRAFFDDGTPLGSRSRDECRIDLVAQAWAVLSDVATPDGQTSMAAVRACWWTMQTG
jgi:cyclic beta-1,2-glucan synthetase